MNYVMNFPNFSKEALEQVINQAPGKPVMNEDGVRIGTVTRAEPFEGTKVVFEFELD